MPIVNIYYPDAHKEVMPTDVTAQLKESIAKELMCGDFALNPADISVRLLDVRGAMIGSVEIDIFAKHFPTVCVGRTRYAEMSRSSSQKKFPPRASRTSGSSSPNSATAREMQNKI
ncbi:MAG: hypothetical protein AAB916_01595 [Patescibacteria group bacterium]